MIVLGIDPSTLSKKDKFFASALVWRGVLFWADYRLPSRTFADTADLAACEGQHTRGKKRSQKSIYSLARSAGWLLHACHADRKGYVEVNDWKGTLFPGRERIVKLAFCRQIYRSLSDGELSLLRSIHPQLRLPDDNTPPEWLDLLDAIGIAKAVSKDPKIVKKVSTRLRDPFVVR